MSGGTFDFFQFRFHDVAELIREQIATEEDTQVIGQLEITRLLLKAASKAVHRVDWYMAGDDGTEAFKTRFSVDMLEPLNAILAALGPDE